MKLFNSRRIPLDEGSFTGADFTGFYDEHARRFMGPVYRRLAARARRIGGAGERVLDIGTGSGRLAIELARSCPDWRITGVDVSEDMLELTRRNIDRSGLPGRIELRQASAAALPFADGSFSLVTSNASLHLWKDPLAVFGEIARVTAPGGVCLIWDNLRLTACTPLLGLFGRAMGMNAAQRRLWLRAIRSSYTMREVRAMVRKSAIATARVLFIPAVFELGIEWRK
jgi:ubiquinone/menaquinone biosynthesis C-methylase UbiE